MSPFGSLEAVVLPRSQRAPLWSSTWMSLLFGSGGSLNAIRTSVGAFTRRASAAGLERT